LRFQFCARGQQRDGRLPGADRLSGFGEQRRDHRVFWCTQNRFAARLVFDNRLVEIGELSFDLVVLIARVERKLAQLLGDCAELLFGFEALAREFAQTAFCTQHGVFLLFELRVGRVPFVVHQLDFFELLPREHNLALTLEFLLIHLGKLTLHLPRAHLQSMPLRFVQFRAADERGVQFCPLQFQLLADQLCFCTYSPYGIPGWLFLL